MNEIQKAIFNSLEAMGEKSRFTVAALAKKLRETAKIDGKKKAEIALDDLLVACEELSAKGKFYSITVTNANDLVIESSVEIKELSLESIQRRHRHEKSCTIFTSNDICSNDNKNKDKMKIKKQKRIQRESMDVLGDYGI